MSVIQETWEENARGELIDTLINAETGEIISVYEDHNLIVTSFRKLVACLMKKETGYVGIAYWENGTGNSSWQDSNLPSPSLSDVALLAPLYRKAVVAGNMKFIDENNAESATPTNRIEVTVIFDSDESNGNLRELALFGGDATADLGSGIMINRKIHPMIPKSVGVQLQRVLRFTF